MTDIIIPLTKGYLTVIDSADADLAQFKWSTKVTKAGKIYATRSTRINGVRVDLLMHRVILSRKLGIELEREQLTDHQDRDSLNNRRSNLRLASHAENCRNLNIGKNNKSGVIGISWNATSRKWAAYISVNSRTKYLGLFDDIAAAIQARRAAEQTYFGEFAPTPADNESEVIQRDSLRPRSHKHRYADAKLRSDNRTGYKGVSLTGQRKKPFAAECAGKKLGAFVTAEEAYAVYCEAYAEHYGKHVNDAAASAEQLAATNRTVFDKLSKR